MANPIVDALKKLAADALTSASTAAADHVLAEGQRVLGEVGIRVASTRQKVRTRARAAKRRQPSPTSPPVVDADWEEI